MISFKMFIRRHRWRSPLFILISYQKTVFLTKKTEATNEWSYISTPHAFNCTLPLLLQWDG